MSRARNWPFFLQVLLMSRAHNWPFFLQVLLALATLLGGMIMLIEMGSVPIPTARSRHIVTHDM